MATFPSNTSIDKSYEPGSRTSNVPLLGEGFSETTGPKATQPTSTAKSNEEVNETTEQDSKTGKRRFWNLGKKKEDPKLKKMETTKPPPSKTTAPVPPMRSPTLGTTMASQATIPASPGRPHHNSSPRPISPASSQIFERNVQEDGLATTASPAIPSHITTENHIPPVLDASSMAITDDHLNPDNVEIVTHAAHQSAAVTVTGTSHGIDAAQPDHSIFSIDPTHPDGEDSASNYGALDTNDVRRLSFISFADVVHAEQADHTSLHASTLSGTASITSPGARSPSPMRSPVSPQTTSGSPSVRGLETFGRIPEPHSKGLETSPVRGIRAPGSPRLPGSPPATTGELSIETMRQALRKTGSGDLSVGRSAPVSAVGGDDGGMEAAWK